MPLDQDISAAVLESRLQTSSDMTTVMIGTCSSTAPHESPPNVHRTPQSEPSTRGDTSAICYGSLIGVVAQVRDDPFMNVERASLEISQCGSLIIETAMTGEYVSLRLPKAAVFACLSARESQVLKQLKTLLGVELESVVSKCKLERAVAIWKKTGKSSTLSIDFNINGSPQSSRKVGDILSAAKLFLQTPTLSSHYLSYENPQYLRLPGVSHVRVIEKRREASNDPVEGNHEVSRAEIDSILDHLPQSKFLRLVSTSNRIRTPLMSYQKEAVDFISRRETGDLPPSLSLWKPWASPDGSFCYKHVITGTKISEMDDIAGGIISDDMGLGKTLSMLSVIVESRHRAVESALVDLQESTNYWETMTPSKATLVVVPNSLLLESWKEEIETHIAPGTMDVRIYHGTNKRFDLPTLLRSDVVITTYATIAADFSQGKSILNHIQWYRLVLDEGNVFSQHPI
ncbi:hypothetical protein NX059_008464 [Plenodomus lindquistii]|nr:hypothetical protein NX059_008464 [Plenodomus lindquistii]